MVSIKEDAKVFQPQAQIKNICELEKVSVDTEIKKETHTNIDNEEFTINFIEYQGCKYRIPNIVRGHLKGLLEKMPNLQYFSVLRQGSGLSTTYQVIPVQE